MINTEEKSHTLNFQRLLLSYGVSIESDIQHSFFEMKDPTCTSWLYFMYVKRPNFQLFSVLTPKVYIAM